MSEPVRKGKTRRKRSTKNSGIGFDESKHINRTESLNIDDMEVFSIGPVYQAVITDFSCSHDSFIPLVLADYQQIACANKEFGKKFPPTAYVYYNIMHLWARLVSIEKQQGRFSDVEIDFLSCFNQDYRVTSAINAYLRGIGRFTDVAFGKHNYKVASLPNDSGHFGRIDAHNHNLYEALPAPSIIWKKLTLELEIEEPVDDWEVEGLRPAQPDDDDDGHDADGTDDRKGKVNLPTVNLLGWGIACPLSKSQRKAYQLAGVVNSDSYDIPRYRFARGMMSAISTALEFPQLIKLVSTEHESVPGSLAQMAFLCPTEQREQYSRIVRYCEINSVTALCGQLDSQFLNAATVFGYRIRKNELNNMHPWCCYSFNNFKEVPEPWIANRNDYFEHGMLHLNQNNFQTAHADLANLQRCFIHLNLK